MEIHPFENGKIIINYPGIDGSVDGYQNKYKKLGDYIISQKLSSVVRLPNPYISSSEFDKTLRKGISYALENSLIICGFDKPEIYLMGMSAGAGAIANLAWEYPEIKKILLIEPAVVTGKEILIQSLKQFKGEVFILVGDSDNALGKEIGKIFYDSATNASKRELKVIKNCDHYFSSEINGRILSQSPFWAFSNNKDSNFPDPLGGIKLYD